MFVFVGDIDGGKILGEYPDDLTTEGSLIVNERGIGKLMLLLVWNYFYSDWWKLLNIIILYYSASNNTL